MQLIATHVKKYKCVDDSSQFSVEPLITCLVGKNESGKSALLEAMYRLNPLASGLPTEFEGLRDYPRSAFASDEEFVDAVTVVATTFELSPDEVHAFERHFGTGALLANLVSFNRNYGNRLLVAVHLDERVMLDHLVSIANEAGLAADGVTGLDDLRELIDAVDDPSEALAALRGRLEIGLPHQARIWLAQRLPRLLLFTQYSTLPGMVSIERLQTLDEQDLDPHERTALSLLRLAKVDSEQFDEANYVARKARLEAAANKLTDQVFEYWSQNRDLEVELDIEFVSKDLLDRELEPFLRIRIRNTKQRVTIDFDERSVGFVWFFSFLAFFAEHRDHITQHILLLDEPGLNLHAEAHADLLRFMEDNLSGRHQVIYTTHSPFMIPDDLARVRLVEDMKGDGSRVLDSALGTLAETQAPLQAAIGVRAARLGVGDEPTLVVEGPADARYLDIMSAELASAGRTGLRPEWNVRPVGGIDGAARFFSLLTHRTALALVVNHDPKHQKRLGELVADGLLDGDRIFPAVTYAASNRSADLEDLFDSEWYLNLLARSGVVRVTPSVLTSRDPRIVRRVEHHLGAPFSRYSPAAYLGRHRDLLRTVDAAARDRFEALFTDLNALL